MNRALVKSLTAAEQRFLAETSRDSLAGLDEDEVLDVHTRARRMRDKYVGNYRRAAGAAVEERGGRGVWFAENSRDRAKAETFEAALARVSRRVGVLAAQAAADLRRERLEVARTERSHPAPAVDATAPQPESRPRGVKKTTGGLKRDASSRAQGARRQAKRDKG
jgi:hypothetical protein